MAPKYSFSYFGEETLTYNSRTNKRIISFNHIYVRTLIMTQYPPPQPQAKIIRQCPCTLRNCVNVTTKNIIWLLHAVPKRFLQHGGHWGDCMCGRIVHRIFNICKYYVLWVTHAKHDEVQ